MRTVLSAFTDRELGRKAAEDLGQAGLTRGPIRIGVHRGGDDPSLGNPIDEAVTGGAITDFVWLLEQLFGRDSGLGSATQPHTTVADIVRAGGAVVVVDAADDAEAARVQAFLHDAGAVEQAHLPHEGDLD